MEKSGVRTSTLATFVLVTKAPDHRSPRLTSSEENRTESRRGAAPLESATGSGGVAAASAPTDAFEGIVTGGAEHA